VVTGFIMEEITNKGKRGIRQCMLANLKKEKLSDEPLKVKFLFVKDQMRATVTKNDIEYYIDHMTGLVGKRDVDFKLEVI